MCPAYAGHTQQFGNRAKYVVTSRSRFARALLVTENIQSRTLPHRQVAGRQAVKKPLF